MANRKLILGILIPPYGIYLAIKYLLSRLLFHSFQNFFVGKISKTEKCPNCGISNDLDQIINTDLISSNYQQENINGSKDKRYKVNAVIEHREYTYRCMNCSSEFAVVRNEQRSSSDGIVGGFIDLGLKSRKLQNDIDAHIKQSRENGTFE